MHILKKSGILLLLLRFRPQIYYKYLNRNIMKISRNCLKHAINVEEYCDFQPPKYAIFACTLPSSTDSGWTLDGLHLESNWKRLQPTICLKFIWSPCGLHLESKWSPDEFHPCALVWPYSVNLILRISYDINIRLVKIKEYSTELHKLSLLCWILKGRGKEWWKVVEGGMMERGVVESEGVRRSGE